jgi:hypothetical protein
MLIEDLDAMYEETFKKNDTIQTLLVEVRDHNEILTFLYDTEIQRPNLTLNSMIDTYESLLLKLRELHTNIMNSLAEFGEEDVLSTAISENESLTEKTRTLMLWKLRRIFMVYDKEPVLPYVEGSLHNLELIPEETAEEPVTDDSGDEDQGEPVTVDAEGEDQNEPVLPPNGGVFPNSGDKNPA